jgi:hypothetical protein
MSQQGNCPKCGHYLTYEGQSLATEDGHSELVYCRTCHWHGYENYAETFVGHEDRPETVHRGSETESLRQQVARLRHVAGLAQNWLKECTGADDPLTGLGSLLAKLESVLGAPDAWHGGLVIEPPPAELDEVAPDGTRSYRVVYEIDLMARDPRDAAAQTVEIFHDPGSQPFFTVIASDGTHTDVDMMNDDNADDDLAPAPDESPVPPTTSA